MATLNLIHQELLNEMGAETEKLTDELKVKIGSLNQMVAVYNQAPDDEQAAKIDKASAKLWHAIKDWEEQGRPEDDGSVAPEVVESPAASVEERRPNFFERLGL
jgi:hypothetical protein